MPTITESLRREWTRFRRPGRLVALAAAALAVVAFGLLYAFGNHASCGGPCPLDPAGPNGSLVNDQFAFAHRDLGENGSITVRMTSMTGTITYPPPHHDQILPGLVPWAKAGIIVKDGVRPGSSYAALMLTGAHGVRMQYDYRHDIAGRAGGVSAESPRWLRLTRSGDTVTGYESADGERWTKVGTARLPGLPATAQAGLFATSPGDLSLQPVGFGGGVKEQVRFTQASGVFDRITLQGAATAGGWRTDTLGEMNRTDWEKYHQPSGAVEKGGTVTVTGVGDIGPAGAEDGARPVESTLGGLHVALLLVLVAAVRFAVSGAPGAPGAPGTRRALAVRAAVVGSAAFATGLLAVGIVVPAGASVLEGNGITVIEVSALTGSRVVVGTAAALALAAVLAFALGTLLRRARLAVPVALLAVALPYAVTSFPLIADGPAQWLLRLTPAAGFAAQQTLVEHPQVLAHYAPSAGYFPLPWWAGLGVLCAWTALLLWLAARRLQQPTTAGPASALPEARLGRAPLRQR
ncbi:hypothetical protein ACIQUQ_05770 [Streptomyces sp. NPDC101118]|uniref:hypothetical protein n=1 Tax=Streptomyces sp. NPDC101118 TaxID=3366109 RepID=UPI0037F396EB